MCEPWFRFGLTRVPPFQRILPSKAPSFCLTTPSWLLRRNPCFPACRVLKPTHAHSAGAGFFVSDQATFWSRKTPYSLGGVVGWKGPWGRPLERVPGNVVLWLCAILMAVEMVVANGSFCFLFFGPEKEPNPGPWILGPTEIACATNWAISAFPQIRIPQVLTRRGVLRGDRLSRFVGAPG